MSGSRPCAARGAFFIGKLQFLNFLEVLVREIEQDYSENYSADGGIGVGAEKPAIYVIQDIPNSPPDQNQRKDDDEVLREIAEKMSSGHIEIVARLILISKLGMIFYIPR